MRQHATVKGSVLLCLIALTTAALCAQEIRLGEPRVVGKGHVALLSDSEEVQAGKPQTVELRFRVEPGFHINSHTPKDELLIPTIWKTDAASEVRVLGESYPKGEAFRLEVGAGETLDVYQGEFRVVLQVVAPKGASVLRGALRYQACDRAACFPPRTLPVMVAVTGK
jgi:hypothetical protein